jgi:hypothetical protein
MREPSLLRTLALPIGVAVIMLFVIPKTCGGLMQKGLKRASTMKKSDTASPRPASGLTIESTTPDANARREVNLPSGLGEERVQYLIEISPRFSEPRRLRVPKVSVSDSLYPLVPVVKRLAYFEKQSDGTLAPTREAALHLPDMTEDSNGWEIPVAKRQYVGILGATNQGDGNYKIIFNWKWEPNDLGRELSPATIKHMGVAFIAGTPGNFALTELQGIDGDWN